MSDSNAGHTGVSWAATASHERDKVFRCVSWLCLALHVCAGDLDSGLHICIVSALSLCVSQSQFTL